MRKRRNRKKLLFLLLLLCIGNSILFGFFLHLQISRASSYPEMSLLKKHPMSFSELSHYFKSIAKEKGAVYAFNVLKIAPIPADTDLHLLGHIVGNELYKQKGIKGMHSCTQDFRNACSHTIVVGYFLEKGLSGLDEITATCQKAPGGVGAYAMCFHGLGHGVLAFVNYDLPKALKICEKTTPNDITSTENVECAGGVTMEMMSGVHDPDMWMIQAKRYLPKSDPLSPCSTSMYTTQTKAMCYTYLTPHLFELAQSASSSAEETYKKAFTFCETLSEDKNKRFERDACFGGFGKEFVVLANERDIRNIDAMTDDKLQKIISWCQLASDTMGRISCESTALRSLYWGGENDRAVSIRFCALIDKYEGQETCMYSLIRLVQSYHNDDKSYKIDFCNELPQTYKNICHETI